MNRRATLVNTAITAAIFGILIPLSVSGARFPNAVEKQIVFRGDAVASVATLLGLSSSQRSSAVLQLGRYDAWAVYLLKQDTKKALSNGNGPARFNLVKFSESPTASLTIGPYWLDLGTRLPEQRVGYYSFGSPFISDALNSKDAWTQLLRRLKAEPGWNGNDRPQFQRCFTSLQKNEICFSVFGEEDYANNHERKGYVVTITAHPAP